MPTVLLDRAQADFAGFARTDGVVSAAVSDPGGDFLNANAGGVTLNAVTNGLQVIDEDGDPLGGNDDTLTLNARIMSGATVLAAATAGGAYQTVLSGYDPSVSGSPANHPSVTFTYVNTAASLTQWIAATIEYQQIYGQNMAPDGMYWIVNAETGGISVDYTAAPVTIIKAWDGVSTWQPGQLRRWNGTLWENAVVNRWNGSAWVEELGNP